MTYRRFLFYNSVTQLFTLAQPQPVSPFVFSPVQLKVYLLIIVKVDVLDRTHLSFECCAEIWGLILKRMLDSDLPLWPGKPRLKPEPALGTTGKCHIFPGQ